MSHEVRALAQLPWRSHLSLGALLAGGLAIAISVAPSLMEAPPEPVPFRAHSCELHPESAACMELLPPELRALPTPSKVEQLCLTALARGLADHPEAPLSWPLCGEELLQKDARLSDGLPSFAEQLSDWRLFDLQPREDTLHSSALAEAAWAAQRVADRYDTARTARVSEVYRWAEEFSQRRMERWEDAVALAAMERSARRWVLALAASVGAVLGLAWLATRPVPVVISSGRVQLGGRWVSLEELKRWDFHTLSLSLRDGTHVRAGWGRELTLSDQVALEQAMEHAMDRVVTAAPLDMRALHAVRELAR